MHRHINEFDSTMHIQISRVVTRMLEQVDRNVNLFPLLIVFKMMSERELKMIDYTTGEIIFLCVQVKQNSYSSFAIQNETVRKMHNLKIL